MVRNLKVRRKDGDMYCLGVRVAEYTDGWRKGLRIKHRKEWNGNRQAGLHTRGLATSPKAHYGVIPTSHMLQFFFFLRYCHISSPQKSIPSHFRHMNGKFPTESIFPTHINHYSHISYTQKPIPSHFPHKVLLWCLSYLA